MIVETLRLEKIGIDRIVLNNFKVENFLQLEKKKIIKQSETIERFEYNDNNYSLTYSMIKNESGEYNIATLEFNPGKMKEGHNLYNASIRDLKISLDEIVKEMMSKGVILDLEEANKYNVKYVFFGVTRRNYAYKTCKLSKSTWAI